MSSVNKLLPLTGNPLIRRLISANEGDDVDLESVIHSGNHLILPELNIGEIGKNSARAIASLLLATIWDALLKRGPSNYRTYIVIDEAREMPQSILEILISQGRKYGLVLILAYQSIGNRFTDSAESLFPNLHNYACFNMSQDDAERIAANISGAMNKSRIVSTLITLTPQIHRE